MPASRNHADDVADLPLAGLQTCPQLAGGSRRSPRFLGQFALELFDEHCDQLRREQLPLEPSQHARFYRAAIDPASVVARAAATVLRAGELAAALRNVGRTTGAAANEARQQILGPVRSVESPTGLVAADPERQLSLPSLDLCPEVVGDDPKVGHRRDLPFRRRIRSGNTLARARVLHIAAAIPFQAADVERVVEDTRRTLGLPADRRVRPRAAPRTRGSVLIQTPGDIARAAPHRELGKDTLDLRSFTLVHSTLAGAAANLCGLDHVVAIGFAAGELTLQRPPQLSPPGLLPQVRQKELGHRAEKADVHRGDLAADGDRI